MSDLTDELIADARERMGKSVEQTQHEFQSVRTGRASPAILDRVVVDYFGVATPLRSLATINAPEARLLTVQPFDPSTMKLLEKAISDSGVGLNPSNDGKVMRLVGPRAQRGAPPRARQGRPRDRRGGPDQDPQHPPRHHAATSRSSRTTARSARTTRSAPRASCRSSPTSGSPSSSALKVKEAEILEV